MIFNDRNKNVIILIMMILLNDELKENRKWNQMLKKK